jgi:hypothetical protein
MDLALVCDFRASFSGFEGIGTGARRPPAITTDGFLAVTKLVQKDANIALSFRPKTSIPSQTQKSYLMHRPFAHGSGVSVARIYDWSIS